jgi:D-alanine--poly(phosphoribitol) ligase subunit 1
MSAGYAVHAAEIFEAVVRQHPARAAIRWSAGEFVTFEALDGYANRIARVLLERGVRKRDRVALALEKSTIAYAAILACLRIGAAYFAVDPANPPARTRTIAGRCQPALAIADPSVAPESFECDVLVAGDRDSTEWLDGAPPGPVDVPWTIAGSDPAYIMFTSGSTGTPKGVTISQNNLVNFIGWTRQAFATRPEDVFTNVNPLFFDNSVFDVYASLFAGASLVPFTAAMLKQPAEALARLEALGCTVYFSVPSLLVYFQTLKLLGPDSFRPLRAIVFGGEGYPKAMLAKLYASVGDRVALLNVYGPTECTCICSLYRITSRDLEDQTGYAPLGRMIPSFSHLVIGEDGGVAAPGAVGELYLGGPCVGLGYFGDPEQTARLFVQNPTHQRFFDRMYKTGDRVREDAGDGTIHFVGRADTQVKRQGYRIELGEIEHALTGLDTVDEAAAVYLPGVGSGRIVAVAVSRVGMTPRAVREALAMTLPAYMLPDKVVVVDALIKNANGKVDRRALAAALERGEL